MTRKAKEPMTKKLMTKEFKTKKLMIKKSNKQIMEPKTKEVMI